MADQDDAVHFLESPDARPEVASNWGIDASPTRLAMANNRRATLILYSIIALVILSLPVLFVLSRSSTPTVIDDAWRTLDAYTRASAAGAPLEEELSPSQRSLLAAASRIRTKDGEMLALRSADTCWAVPVSGGPSTPVEVDRTLCQ